MSNTKKMTYTKEGYAALQRELSDLYAAREKNKEDIAQARSYGDLSENSEYDEAKKEQGRLAVRIMEVEYMINNAEIIDDRDIDSSVVNVGSLVTVDYQEKGCDVVYHIVGSYETDPRNGKISDVSPIGSALVGSHAGDMVEVELPNGKKIHLTVKNVERATV